MNKLFFTLLFFICTAFFAVGQTYSPTNGATNVDLQPTLTLTLSGSITLANGQPGLQYPKAIYVISEDNQHIIEMKTYTPGPPFMGGGPQDPRLSVNNNVLEIDLSKVNDPLRSNTNYYVSATPGTILLDGNPWNNLSTYPSPWNFTTKEVTPVTANFTPENGATGVSINPTLTIEFNNTPTINEGNNIYILSNTDNNQNNIALTTGDPNLGTPMDSRIQITDNSLVIDLSSTNLVAEETYKVYVPAGTINVEGNPWNELSNISSPKWIFTTENITTTANFTPENGTTGVSTNPTLTIEFNSTPTINKGSNIYILSNTGNNQNNIGLTTGDSNLGTPMDSRIQITGNSLVVDLSSTNLAAGETYKVHVPAGIINIGGNPWNELSDINNPNWIFTTENITTTANFTPENGATGVSTNPTLTIEFNSTPTINKGSNIYILSNTGNNQNNIGLTTGDSNLGTPMDSRIQITGNSLVIDLSSTNLAAGETYKVYVPAGIINIGGNPWNELSDINNPNWTFTTLANTTAPITSCSAEGLPSLSLIDTIFIEFNVDLLDNNFTADKITFQYLDESNNVTETLVSGTDYIFTEVEENKKYGLIPNTFLYPKRNCKIIVSEVTGSNNVTQPAPTEFTFTTMRGNIWDVNTSGTDFSTHSNWIQPYDDSAAEFILPDNSNVVINDNNSNIYALIVAPKANLEIAPGANLALNYKLVLQSDSLRNASFINRGSLVLSTNAATAQIEQFVTTQGPSNWENIGTPVSDVSFNQAGGTYKIYKHGKENYAWQQVSNTENLSPGEGYAIKSERKLIYFSRNLNNEDSYTLLSRRRANGNECGWSFLSNPYTASIDWNEVTRNNVKNKFWIRVHRKQYVVYDGDTETMINDNLLSGNPNNNISYIPSSQGFYVQTVEGEEGQNGNVDGSITISKSGLVHNSYSYTGFKSKNKKQSNVSFIKLRSINGDKTDECLISFIDDAKPECDNYDADKIFSKNDDIMELYTKVGKNNLVINSVGALNKDIEIPLGIKANKKGSYKIKLSKINKLDDYDVFLVDNTLNKTFDLKNEGAYEFSTDKVNNTDRFKVVFKQKEITSVKEQINNNIDIYSNNKILFINVKDINLPLYKIYDVTGKLFKMGKLDNNSLNSININNSGTYIVKVIGDNTSKTKTISIQ